MCAAIVNHSRSIFLFTALLVVLVMRVAPYRSRRVCGAALVASGVVVAQFCAWICGSTVMLLTALAFAACFALLFVGLFVWRPATIPTWTVSQRIATLVLALAIALLPMWVVDAVARPGRNYGSSRGNGVFPEEILGLRTSAVDCTNGMVRSMECRVFDGQHCEIGFLTDETPRKIGGSVFVVAKRKCTAKKLLTVSVVADTGTMTQSDEKAVVNLAQSIADAVSMSCGLEMKHPLYSSISGGRSGNVVLFEGGDGIRSATLSWIGHGDGNGNLRLSIHDAGRICEGSPLYAELMAK